MSAIIESAIQGYRISPQQERLWLLTRDHERTPYRAQCALRIDGAIDAFVVQRAVRQVVERHEILRTTFQYLPEMILPVQVIHNSDSFAWEEHDLTGLSKSEQQAMVETLRHGAWTRPLDFSCGPLLNLMLLTLGQASYLLMVTLPALCADSAALGNVAREIARACAMGGDAHSVADACVQYADFAEWQHTLLDADGDPGRAYWRKQALSHSSSVFHARLPFELSTTESLGFAPLSQSMSIPADLAGRINELAESTETSVAAVFIACWQVLLDRLTDQANIRIGAMCDNRIYQEFERALGPFSKFLPVFCGVERELSFRTTLAKFHAALSATRKWQEYFVWDEINPSATDALNRPFFHFCFEYDEQPVPYVADGISIDCDWFRAYMDRFKVMLSVMRKGSLLEAALHYDASIYPAGAITTLADQYETLLSDAVCRPDEVVMRLRMLSDVERQKLLHGFNPTQGGRPQDTRCLHETIEAQVIRTPEATAVVCGDQSLSYVELDRRANQLARYLLSRGVGPDVLVAISVERSIEMVVGLLGILKAGGAYVPIDPGYPKDRIRVMLEDSCVPLLLTQERLLTNLPAANVDILCLDRDWPLVAEYTATAPSTCATSENLAYVIFTSGSTGRPKGVMVSHYNVVQSTRARSTYYHEPIRGFLLFSSFAFDSSVAGLFWTLSTGGCLCIPDEEAQKDPLALLNLMSQHRVSHLLCLPSFYAVLLQQITPTQAGSLCTVIVAGEACPQDVVAQHYGKLSKALLFNEYGPTEGTVWSSVYQVGVPDRELTVPIGSPIAHTQIYVLEKSLEPVPIGISGDLYIGGAGTARGYLNRPELTAERFMPNPFSTEPGERFYRTGDLARYRVDGNIEYLGRVDHQVKVRGFRIELGEIEARLLEHPQVKEAVVIAREDTPGDKRLVGYVVVGQAPVPSVDELRTHTQQTLPEYMVPGAFVFLEALPLTPNGKVDRKALPAPDIEAQLAEQYVAPRTATEEVLANIWAEVLGVERVGIHDNFFMLGGDSILSIQVVSRARHAGVVITPKALFQHQTVAGLAPAAGGEAVVKAEQGLVVGEAPLTPIQAWFFEQSFPTPHHWNQSILLVVRESLDVKALASVIESIEQQHDTLRSRFVSEGNYWRQHIVAESSPEVFQRVDLSGVSEAEQSTAIEAEAGRWQASLSLNEGPLWRVVWFDLGAGRSRRLLIVIHHLVVDGVSWRVLLEDLQRAYAQAVRGESLVFPSKTTSFKRWSERLWDYARSAALRNEVPYWLAAAGADLEPLPVDDPQGENIAGLAESVVVLLDETETDALLREVPQVYGTQINDILLTALAQTLCEWTETDEVVIELEGHGREDVIEGVDISRTIGWFTSVSPVRLALPTSAAPGEALKSVKEQLHGIPNKGVGYGILRYLGPTDIVEQLQSQPSPQISFNYLGQFDTTLAEDGPFAPALEATGPEHAVQSRRVHELDISANISSGQLEMAWNYSGARYRRKTIERLAHAYLGALKRLITHCLSPDAGGYTPSDFPLAKLEQGWLDRVLGHRRQIEEVYPVAPLQQGLLFHSLYAPESGVYFEQVSITLEGTLDETAFIAAWQRIVDAHPILRTCFLWEGLEAPLQVVHRQVEVPVERDDWRERSPTEQTSRWQDYLAADRARGFEFSQVPLMRLGLIRCAECRYYLVWSHHHSLLDGWSVALIFQDVMTAYESRGGTVPQLPPRRPYRDYIAWLARQDRTAAVAYWRDALEGLVAPTPLGIGKPLSEPMSDVAEYDQASLCLSNETASALEAWVKRYGLTLNTVVQGTWGLLLSRYGGERDIVFGITVPGRPAELVGVESMVGLFINTLPLRVRVSPEASVTEWFHALMAQNLELRRYEYLPLVDIQGLSEVPRGQPLFETLLVFENYPVDRSVGERAESLGVDEVHVAERTNYPLTLFAVPDAGLKLRIDYDSGRFEKEVIRRLLGHFEVLLEGIVAHREARLSDLPLLTEAERQQLLNEWNATQTEYPKDKCIHQLFEAQVERGPEATAVVYEDQSLTYRELNAKANQLAHHLRSMGVGPDTLVGICVERSLEMVVGLVGILKAGGAYLPLDPTYPKERLAYMLEDTQPSVLLTQARLRDALPVHSDIVCLDTDWAVIARRSKENLTNLASPLDLAYVIYTSGSTGRPKGVSMPHGGLVNLLSWQSRCSSAEIRTLQLTTLSFDVSFQEIFSTFLQGGTVVLCGEDLRGHFDRLVSFVVSQQVERLFLPFVVLQHLAKSVGRRVLGEVKEIITAGEQLQITKEIAELCQTTGCSLHNQYGPTESHVVTAFPLQKDTASWPALPPIGQPIANTQIFLLDAHLNPVPEGVVGELYIGGVGLARGYMNRPELTAERFIPNPFSNQRGERLYRTGDLTRYRVDGNVEYLGRIDHQVKVRGFRIELGEIEARLAEHPRVKEAVVIVREDTPGEKRLVAYVVGQEPVSTVDELRARLKETLPQYMVPSTFVFLDALPLTSNGKVNRKALPAPDIAKQFAHRYVAPRNDIEAQLAGIWAEVLRAERIGIHDNFFDLGGHSVTAVQLIVRLRERFGGNLPLASLFEAPTVAEMAAFMSRQDTGVNQHAIDWQSEATPDASIAAKAVSVPFPVALGAVFVTGATGFLGVFLVQELLQQTPAKIYCLVRAVTDAEAAQKLEKSFVAYGFGTNDRVIPVLGNLAKPGLGIREDQFRKLSDEVDTVYHSGALVNFVYPYHLLSPVNVLGTEEVLRFACLGKLKSVHYVSTLGIFGNSPSSNPEGFTEDEFPQTAVHLSDGYSQSKWVAEKMVRMAGERGIPICIYRPGNISGHSHTGAWNTSDFICRIIKGYVDTGHAPAEHTDLDLAPVDYVSKAIVYLSRKPESLGQPFNLNNPSSLSSRLFVDALRAEGFKLNLVSMSEWLSKIAEAVNGSAEHPLYPLASLFEQSDLGQEEVSHSPRIDCKKAAMALDGNGIVCPVIDSKMVHRYIAYLIRSGFLKSPLCTAADAL